MLSGSYLPLGVPPETTLEVLLFHSREYLWLLWGFFESTNPVARGMCGGWRHLVQLLVLHLKTNYLAGPVLLTKHFSGATSRISNPKGLGI